MEGPKVDSIKKLETLLAGVFKASPPLSANARQSLVSILPALALIFGVLQLLAAAGLWSLARSVERLNTIVNIYTYHSGLSAADRFVIYLGIIALVADAVILLMAYSHLVKRAARGWDLLFLGSLINVVYSIVSLFITDRGVGSFIFSGLFSAIGFYLLFQVRSAYKGKGSKAKKLK
jgi:hypothetical protein